MRRLEGLRGLRHIEGALHHGLGYAVVEDLKIDEQSGAVTTGTFMDYKLLTEADMPKVETVLVEAVDPTGPFGAKGVGEPGLAPRRRPLPTPSTMPWASALPIFRSPRNGSMALQTKASSGL